MYGYIYLLCLNGCVDIFHLFYYIISLHVVVCLSSMNNGVVVPLCQLLTNVERNLSGGT